MSYGKRKYMHKTIASSVNQLYYGAFEEQLRRGAENIDNDGTGREISTLQYIAFLKKNDNQVKKLKYNFECINMNNMSISIITITLFYFSFPNRQIDKQHK